MSRELIERIDPRLVFRQSRQAVIVVGTDAPTFTILDVNDAYLAVTHSARADLLGRPLFEAFPESVETTQEHGSHRIAASLERALTGQRDVLPVQRYDLPVPGVPDAFVEHWWELSSGPLFDDAGAIVALVHEVQNVTDRERAERERRRLSAEAEAATRAAEAAEEQLQRVFAQAPADIAVTMGPEHRFVLANPGYERLVGRRVPIGALFRDVLPDVVAQGFGALLDRVYRTGQPHAEREAHALLTKDGAALEDGWYDFVYQPLLDADGTVTGVLQHAVDVTARVRAERAVRDSEAALRTFADAIPTLAWTARPDGWIEWFNEQWYRYTGTTPAEMEGAGWRSVPDPAALPAVLEGWQRSIRTGDPFELTFPLRGADGAYRPFLTRMVAAKNAEGAVVRWFGTSTDVEREHAARRQAEEANAAKTTFLATMSHELRTPLNALGGYLELLLMGLRGPLTAEQRTDLERMQRSHRHLLRLINDVLNFAKIDTGHADFEIADVNVGAVLRRVEELVSPQCAVKSIACVLTVETPDPVARADDERLGQILLNLLGNAVKYTAPGGRIVASCARAGDVIRVRVEDTGVGIPADQLESIFDPFVQVGRRLNAPGEGVGLGLAIARSLAEGMHGSLSAESVVGVGSVFTLTLPAARLEQRES